jgi:hypothetical protein
MCEQGYRKGEGRGQQFGGGGLLKGRGVVSFLWRIVLPEHPGLESLLYQVGGASKVQAEGGGVRGPPWWEVYTGGCIRPLYGTTFTTTIA